MSSQPVEIVETHEFKRNYKKLISELELEAIRHLLAAKPGLGKSMKTLPGLLRLDWRPESVYIVYMVSTVSESLTIHLIAIGSTPPAPDGGDRKQISDLLDTLKKIGIGLGIREIAKKLWELMRENLP
ncbi:MAG: hypothetical protein Q8K34_12390 [Hydrogenophaga sp.]|nr:hypothetical protein [Hydrogenophaga sp.]